ncbi:peptidase [Burkholderia sp. Bp9012]|nr:peptidase [Burkholderia sp. Bp9012]
MAQMENPILRVDLSEHDYRDAGGGGGGPKELVPITPQLRNELRASLAGVRQALSETLRRYPQLPAVMVMHLRDTAIAKSHRPATLAQEGQTIPIGNAALGEVLLATSLGSFDAMDRVIATRTTRQIKANLSAISGFEAWGIDRVLDAELRNPAALERLQAWRNADIPILIELFHQPNAHLQQVAEELFQRVSNQLGLDISERHPGLVGRSYRVRNANLDSLHALSLFSGIRRIFAAPMIAPVLDVAPMAEDHGPLPGALVDIPNEAENLPIVGVFDTGMFPNSVALGPWVAGRETYVLPPDTDYVHGTMVSSIVCAARPLNGNDIRLPDARARILDVAGMEVANANADDIIERLRAAVQAHPAVKVWNLSLGTVDPAPEDEFGWLAQQLDRISDEFNVLFVVSAGNEGPPNLRGWPPGADNPRHRISSPGDSVRSLTVGALAHRENAPHTLVHEEEPSPFSRRGPGPVRTPKPDVVHYGGNCNQMAQVVGAGVHTVLPGDRLGMTLGTSFSAPMVAAQAAQLWQELEQRGTAAYPALVKALLIHSAAVRSPERDASARRFYGAGVPSTLLDTLFCDDDSFTLLFEVDVADRRKWTRLNYPIPACLRPEPDKFRGEAFVTLVYSPPLDASQGAEYVRANVDISFGRASVVDGRLSIKGLVPLEQDENLADLYETARIENGYKWSPVKVYRERFRNGITAANWALQASITRRFGELIPPEPQRAVILVTLRALEDGLPVYADGIRALATSNWTANPISQRLNIAR